MDDLLSRVAQPGAKFGFHNQRVHILVIYCDNINGLKIKCRARNDHSLSRIKDFNCVFGSCRANRRGKILAAKNDRVQARMCCDFPQVQDSLGRLHTDQNTDGVDRPAVLQLRGFDHPACPFDVIDRLNFGNDDPIRAIRQYGSKVILFKTRTNRINTYQFFAFSKIQFLQGLYNRRARLYLPIQGGSVFHIHANGIDPECYGFCDLLPVITRHVKKGAARVHSYS